MKKIFSIILALTLVMSLSVSSLAMYTFKTVEDDGTVWVYHFDAMDKNATDAGIFLNGVKYNLDGEGGTKASAGETALADAKASGVYGIGFNVTNYQEESYSAQPYYTLNGEDVKGEVENIELNITPYEQVATLSSIKITHSSISDYTVNLQENVYNYYISSSDVGLSGNTAYVNAATTATPTVEGATVESTAYLSRLTADNKVVGKTFEYTVTALDGTTTKKYVVQIADNGYVPPVADTYVNTTADKYATKNYGTATNLIVKSGIYSLIKFYIGNIDTTNLSKVNLNVIRTSNGVNSVNVCKVLSNDWDELTYTPATAGNVVIGDTITTVPSNSITKEAVTTIDITQYVKDAKNAGEDYITIGLQSNDSNSFYFASREYSTPKHTPLLTVIYNTAE